MFGLLVRKPEGPFFKAAWVGDAAKVKETLTRSLTLLNARVSANVRREHPELEEGATAMHLAARRGHSNVVELLFSLRADPSITTPSGATPLHHAAVGGHEDVAQILVDHNAAIDAVDEDGQTPLHRAARAGHSSVVEFLILRGASIQARDQDGSTPLLEAAHSVSIDTLRAILGAGGNVRDHDEKGRTALHHAIIGASDDPAADGGHHNSAATVLHFVETLLSLGLDVNALDQAGETPLDLLVYLGGRNADPDLINRFLSQGGTCVRYRKLQPHPSNAAATVAPIAQAPAAPPSPAAALAAARHRASWGEQPIVLGDQTITFGRNPECTIRYLSLTLSHNHAKIERHEKGWVISDMGSRNGVLIDNAKINGPHLLHANELITLGAYEFEFDGEQLLPTHGELPDDELLGERQRAQGMRAPRTPTPSADDGPPHSTTLPPSGNHDPRASGQQFRTPR